MGAAISSLCALDLKFKLGFTDVSTAHLENHANALSCCFCQAEKTFLKAIELVFKMASSCGLESHH
eukprot:scaffold145599_cov17-Tisochrysis_lutea.AAC.1